MGSKIVPPFMIDNNIQRIAQSTTEQIPAGSVTLCSSNTSSSESYQSSNRAHNILSETITTHVAQHNIIKRPIPPPPIRRNPRPPIPPPKTHTNNTTEHESFECKIETTKPSKKHKRKKHRRHHRSSQKDEIEDISTDVFLKLLLMIDKEEKRKGKIKTERSR